MAAVLKIKVLSFELAKFSNAAKLEFFDFSMFKLSKGKEISYWEMGIILFSISTFDFYSLHFLLFGFVGECTSVLAALPY